MQETLIDLIRHGQPEGGNRYRGHGIDDPLSDSGWDQMWDAVGKDAPWQSIVTSPLKRCLEFANALASRHGLPVSVEDRFREVGFGSWEGRSRPEIQRDSPDEYEAFYRDPVNNRPPGSENLIEFQHRVGTAYDGVVSNHSGGHALIVTHAGVIRAIIARNLRTDPAGMYRIRVPNAGVSRIQHGRFGACVEFVNRNLS
ncbi:MAG: alpha-ribazole phosphatase family protein [Pseudomonadota bacterium]|nr:alpha-ribazole phosphatase family protein [Pseudomonadota bacterium]